MNEEVRSEELTEGYCVYVTKEHGFGTDSFLLADFSKVKHKDRVCELGTGCGIVSILIYRKFKPSSIFAVDVLESAVKVALKTVESSKLTNVIKVEQRDLKEVPNFLNNSFDVVVCNPPYTALNSGILSYSKQKQIEKHEVMCTIKDVCCAAKRLLEFGGRLILTSRANRLVDVFQAMRANSIEPKTIQFWAKDENSKPWIVLIEGRKGAKSFLEVNPTKFVYNNMGEKTQEIKKVYEC